MVEVVQHKEEEGSGRSLLPVVAVVVLVCLEAHHKWGQG